MSKNILEWMANNHIPQTADEYAALNWNVALEDLDGEELAEVLRLVEAGALQIVVPGSELIQ